MKHLKKFEQHSDYTEFTQTTDFVKPNVSWCVIQRHVHYNKFIETRLVVRLNLSSDKTNATIFNNGSQYNSIFSAIEVDGTTLPSVASAANGIALSAGEHVIKYTLSDPTTIGESAFDNCGIVATSVYIPEGVTTIEDYAFYGNDITSFRLPNTLTTIGEGAFSYNSNVTTITLPPNAVNIGYDAFQECNSLSSIGIPEGVTEIKAGTFSGSGLTTIILPNTITSIGNSAFQDCTGLTNITLSDSLSTIGDHAFNGCTSLTEVTIPDGVTIIGNSSFRGCTSLTNVTVPQTAEYVYDYAFYNCTSLSDIRFLGLTPPDIVHIDASQLVLESHILDNTDSHLLIGVPETRNYPHTAPSEPWYKYRDHLIRIIDIE